ncbi:MAG: Exonuclease small subunit [Actinomycetota bacterium]|jgi:exodeoxyribonuclease VII small subunit
MDIQEILKLDAKTLESYTYEQARELLDVVVAALDDSSLPLSQLMRLWEVGETITKVCQTHLEKAAKKLDDGLPTS